jgi:hypothetical protein
MAEQMIQQFYVDCYVQFPGIRPIQLQQLSGFTILRKEHLPIRSLGKIR